MIQFLNNIRKSVFGTTPQTADNALARLADVNTLIDQINRSSASRLFNATAVTQSGGGAPIVTSVAAADCLSGAGTCKICCNNPCAYHNSTSIAVVETVPGNYTVTIVPSPLNPPNINYIDSYLKVGNFNTIGSAATVEKTGLYTFLVKTFDTTTGIVASGLFKDTIIEATLVTCQG